MKRVSLGLVAGLMIVMAFASKANAAPPDKFQGLYGGFFSGYAGVGNDFSDQVGSIDFDLDGWINGLTAGYNFRHDRILFGVEVDGGILEAQDRQACPGGGLCEVDISWMGTARGRVGYIFGDDYGYALYVTGGFAVAGIDAQSTLALGGPQHFHMTGYVIGGGGEAYLFETNYISTKIEYQYVDFGDGETFFSGSATSGELELDMHLVKIGLNIHF